MALCEVPRNLLVSVYYYTLHLLTEPHFLGYLKRLSDLPATTNTMLLRIFPGGGCDEFLKLKTQLSSIATSQAPFTQGWSIPIVPPSFDVGKRDRVIPVGSQMCISLSPTYDQVIRSGPGHKLFPLGPKKPKRTLLQAVIAGCMSAYIQPPIGILCIPFLISVYIGQ